MYSPAGSGYRYSPSPQAPVSQMDRLNISASDRGRSGLTADYGRADNGYVPGSYGYRYCTVYFNSFSSVL